ncbi:P-loop containing nucleoside triphosphate hydrolase protein [Amylostereum chailletii]|nr:P-loop containing nucleoside triphosphate hydrolase protein [Amylostereum chailletii]
MSVLTHIIDHIHDNLHRHNQRPLFVALQGPQGSGKTYLTDHIAASLSSSSLRVATLSIDDLYLPHADLDDLATRYPHNGLLHGRGQPGTHDVAFGFRLLKSLKTINETGEPIRVPSFDKSLFDGEGDRVPESQWTTVKGPLDVVLLEGWCTGFYPQSRQDIETKRTVPPLGLDDIFDITKFSPESVLEVNGLLANYVPWWDLFDVFVQIAPPESNPYMPIYTWRLQQEHAMKAKNGGKGMTDEQVKLFIDRYIPGYHFFGDGVTEGGVDPTTGARLIPPWVQGSTSGGPRMLRVTIGEARELLTTSFR